VAIAQHRIVAEVKGETRVFSCNIVVGFETFSADLRWQANAMGQEGPLMFTAFSNSQTDSEGQDSHHLGTWTTRRLLPGKALATLVWLGARRVATASLQTGPRAGAEKMGNRNCCC